jgi:hypothetical protein
MQTFGVSNLQFLLPSSGHQRPTSSQRRQNLEHSAPPHYQDLLPQDTPVPTHQFASRPCRIPLGSVQRDPTLSGDNHSYITASEEPPPPYSTLPRDSEQRRPNPDPHVFYPGPPPPPVIEGYIPVVHASPKMTSLHCVEAFSSVVPSLVDRTPAQETRQTWREISVVTLILCPPLGALCLLFSCLATRAFNSGKPEVGRRRAKNALHLAIFTMAFYGCALIIYLAFNLQKPSGEDTFLWRKV